MLIKGAPDSYKWSCFPVHWSCRVSFVIWNMLLIQRWRKPRGIRCRHIIRTHNTWLENWAWVWNNICPPSETFLMWLLSTDKLTFRDISDVVIIYRQAHIQRHFWCGYYLQTGPPSETFLMWLLSTDKLVCYTRNCPNAIYFMIDCTMVTLNEHIT